MLRRYTSLNASINTSMTYSTGSNPMKSIYNGLEDLTIPNDWEDITSGNDVCPSYLSGKFQIFCEHKEAEQREFPSWKRFQVIQVNDDFEPIDKGIGFESETIEEVLSMFKRLGNHDNITFLERYIALWEIACDTDNDLESLAKVYLGFCSANGFHGSADDLLQELKGAL